MESEIQITEQQRALAELSERDRSAYELTVRTKQPPMAPVRQAQAFELFLNGVHIDDILKTMHGFSRGQLTQARIEGLWDKKRQEHRDHLLNTTRARLEQTLMESFEFLNLNLAVAHKLHKQQMLDFLATGDPTKLGNFAIQGMKAYMDTLTALRTLGGGKAEPPEAPAPPERTVQAVRPVTQEPPKQIEAAKTIQGVVEARRLQRIADQKPPETK